MERNQQQNNQRPPSFKRLIIAFGFIGIGYLLAVTDFLQSYYIPQWKLNILAICGIIFIFKYLFDKNA